MTGRGGAQPERSALAWRRTALALVAVAVVAVRLGGAVGPAGPALAAAVALGAAVAAGCAELRLHEVLHHRRGTPQRVPVALVAGVSWSVTLVGAGALALLLLR